MIPETYIGQYWEEAMDARPVSPFQPKFEPPKITYEEFLKRKIELSHDSGWEITDDEINPFLKPHQRVAVRWGVKGGRRAWFMSFGLGKTVIQLETLRIILKKVGGRGLIVAPLGVRQEFKRDAQKLGIEIKFIRSIDECDPLPKDCKDCQECRRHAYSDATTPGFFSTECEEHQKPALYITNYETVREGKLDPNDFTATSLDEAACFAPGTLVETSNGPKPIEQVKVGERILNAAGTDTVRAIHRNAINTAVRLRIGNRTIVTSPDHRFFTSKGWVCATELQPGDSVMETSSAMRLVWRRDHPDNFTGRKEAFLQSELLSEMADVSAIHTRKDHFKRYQNQSFQKLYQSQCGMAGSENMRMVRSNILPKVQLGTEETILRAYMFRQMADVAAWPQGDNRNGLSHTGSQGEKTQKSSGVVGIGKPSSGGTKIQIAEHCANGRIQAEGVGDYACSWNSAEVVRREGKRLNAPPVYSSFSTRDGVEVRVHCFSQPAPTGSSDLSVYRYCEPLHDDRYRSGRRNAQDENMAGEGREEKSVSELSRVDSVEILEPGHPELERFRQADGIVYFYDLSATRHPSYSVDGLLVHNCLRGFGGSKTFREFMRLFEHVKYKFVATATPSPNEYIELLAYSAYLGIMDVGGAKTRFFKRDSTKADKLTIHPHKEEEFYIWLASWALFCPKPSVFGFSDAGYALPPMRVIHHEVKANHEIPVADRNGQARMFRNSALGLSDAAREKRESLDLRVLRAAEIVAECPEDHWLLWHDLEDERRHLEKAIPNSVSIYGKMRTGAGLDKVEENIIAFSEGRKKRIARLELMVLDDPTAGMRARRVAE